MQILSQGPNQNSLVLPLIVALQMACTAALCMAVVWAEDTDYYDNFEQLNAATWILYNWNFSWLRPTLLSLFLLFWLGMHLGLKINNRNNTKPKFCICVSENLKQFIVTFSYVGFSCVTALFFAYASADAVCDPIVRLIQIEKNQTELLPLSEVPNLDPNWIRESDPIRGSTPCVAYTKYAEKGQRLVTIAASACIAAFIISIVIRPQSAKHAVFCCALVVVLLGCVTQVIINEDEWDWRVANSLLAAFAPSAYLAACVVSLKHSSSWWESMAWVYVQLALACEDAALSLAENSSIF
jgi:hypothetical protein